MRKSLIWILIVVIFFAIFYLSISYYMGIQAEHKITTLVKSYNSELIKVEVKKIVRGTFHSNAELEVQFEDYNKFNLTLELFHAPVFLYTDNAQKTKLYLFKSLVNIKIAQTFLQENYEIISNTSVIDLLKPVDINIQLTGLTKIVHSMLASSNTSVENDDAYINIKLDPDKIVFRLNGKVANQSSKTYQVDNSHYQISLVLSKMKLQTQDANNWQSKISSSFSANSFIINKKFTVFNPDLKIAYKGSIRNLLNLINLSAKKNLQQILAAIVLNKQYQDFFAEITAKQINYQNVQRDNLKIANPTLVLDIKSFEDRIYFINKISSNKVEFTSKTDKFSNDNINSSIDLSIDKDVLIDYEKDALVNTEDLFANIFNKAYETNLMPLELKKIITLKNLNGQGLLIGKINLDNYNSELVIENDSKDKSDKSSLSYNLNLAKLIVNNEALGVKIDTYVKNISSKNYFNITEYLNYLEGQSPQVYNINLSTKIDAPRIKLGLKNDQLALIDFVYAFNFVLNPKVTGYLNTDSKLSVLSMSIKDKMLSMNNIHYKSLMKQKYKHLLIGMHDLYMDKFDIINGADLLTANNVRYISKSDHINNKLSYGNSFVVQDVKFKDSTLGFIKYKDSYYDIKTDKYLDFITNLSAENLEGMLGSENTNSANLNGTETNKFLAAGMSGDNSFYLGQVKDNLVLINSFKIKPKFKTNNPSQDGYDLLSQLQLNTSIALSKNYSDKLIQLINDPQITEQYILWQKVGLINFKNNTAKIDVLYDKHELKINDDSWENWQVKYQQERSAKPVDKNIPDSKTYGKSIRKKEIEDIKVIQYQ